MQQEVDYTKMRISKKNHIVKCPKCGKNGQLHNFTNGQADIFHKKHFELFCYNITESCFFKDGYKKS